MLRCARPLKLLLGTCGYFRKSLQIGLKARHIGDLTALSNGLPRQRYPGTLMECARQKVHGKLCPSFGEIRCHFQMHTSSPEGVEASAKESCKDSNLTDGLQVIADKIRKYTFWQNVNILFKWIAVIGVSAVVVCYISRNRGIEQELQKKVQVKFEEGNAPDNLRSPHRYIKRDVEDVIIDRYLDKEDTGGMFGVVFGAAGTGKSNILRHISRERWQKRSEEKSADETSKSKSAGVLYMEFGCDQLIAHQIARACGIPLERDIVDMIASYLFPKWERHLDLSSYKEEPQALMKVFTIIEEGGKLYKKENGGKVPLLIIDGADLVAKNNEPLFHALVEWVKKCANDSSVLILLGSSDGHVLRYLDKQACKSRSDKFIEVKDFDLEKHKDDLKEGIFERKKIPDDVMDKLLTEVTGGRLTDIYKAIGIYERVKKTDPPPSDETIIEKIKDEFRNEITQALNKAMDDPRNRLQQEIVKVCIQDENTIPSVHNLALNLTESGKATSISAAMKEMEKFVEHNVLCYNEEHKLVPHSMMAKNVLEEHSRKWEEAWKKKSAEEVMKAMKKEEP